MSMLRDRGFDVTLAVFSALGEYLRGPPRHRWATRKVQMRRDFGLQIERIPSPPSRARHLWDEGALFRRWLRRHVAPSSRAVIHCRGAEAALIAHGATKPGNGLPIVFDCRGFAGAEYLLVNGYGSAEMAPPHLRREAEHRDDLQRRAAETSHAVICVSDAMKREAQREWSIPAAKICVVPCCTDAESGARGFARRAEVRAQLGMDGRFVIAYCGSHEPWQMLPESLQIVRSIFRLRPDAHFLAITSNPQGLNALADQNGVCAGRRTVLSVPHGEVAAYLVAADVGLLLRSNSKVNQVASPVKFAEYLASGLPVILTEGIGDYSDLVRRERIGCIIKGLEASAENIQVLESFLSDVDRNSTKIRNRCIATADRHLNWKRSIANVSALYDSLVDPTEMH